ncbi:MAG: hypothetical protein JWL81_1355, partial [Verrucomicrobiales bacterium]|nr:hypothetical protein [Verrucomicrobiales bacterium]
MKNVHVFPFIFLAGASVAAAQSTSTGATATLLHAPAGDSGGGGQVTGPTVTSEISVGDAASGIVTNVSANGVVAKGNFIGQLYQTESFAITATPP